MAQTTLILAPVLILGVVLILGFAGCGFQGPTIPPTEPTPALTFRARVPTALTVPMGVTFIWTRPGGVQETATATASTPDGADNAYELAISTPEAGGWVARCEMTVQEGGQAADATSGDFQFMPDFTTPTPQYVLLFQASGGPLEPPFKITTVGLMQA